MDLNLFGAEDEVASSGFSANLKQETYDTMIVTFNSIVAGKAEVRQDKDTDDKNKTKND